jgi:hypothetical protein
VVAPHQEPDVYVDMAIRKTEDESFQTHEKQLLIQGALVTRCDDISRILYVKRMIKFLIEETLGGLQEQSTSKRSIAVASIETVDQFHD